MCACMHNTFVEVRGQCCGGGSLLSPFCGFWGLELRSPGLVTKAEPSHQLSFISFFTIHPFTYSFINSLNHPFITHLPKYPLTYLFIISHHFIFQFSYLSASTPSLCSSIHSPTHPPSHPSTSLPTFAFTQLLVHLLTSHHLSRDTRITTHPHGLPLDVGAEVGALLFSLGKWSKLRSVTVLPRGSGLAPHNLCLD